MSTGKVYRGMLMVTGNGEDDDLLGLMSSPHKGADILAETLNDHLESFGRFVTVRYAITDTPRTADEIASNLSALVGEGEFEYSMRYSEITGYLWTDEELQVGGHDLLAELRSHLGKYLHMEIDYSREP